MKVAVVGTLLWDTIHSWQGPSRTGPGGIAYNVSALAAILGEKDRVAPLCWLGGEHLETLRTAWAGLIPPLDMSRVRPSPAGSDMNELTYDSRTRRREVMALRCPPVGDEMLQAEAVLLAELLAPDLEPSQLAEVGLYGADATGHTEIPVGLTSIEAAVVQLARAASPSPVEVNEITVSAATAGLDPEQIIEVLAWLAVLQMLHRLYTFYDAQLGVD